MSRRDDATGAALTAIVAYEAAAFLTGRPKITSLCRKHPVLAFVLPVIWLAHVFLQAARELEPCDDWH